MYELKHKPLVSFEFFPPRSEAMEKKLWLAIAKLVRLNPRFVSVTCGAGGGEGGAETTFKIVTRIQKEFGTPAAAHFTVAGVSREESDRLAKRYWDNGITRLVALRGDPPNLEGKYVPHPDGYAYAADLVEGLAKIGDFEINVAAYPETHPDAPSPEFDLENLKRKCEAGKGATRAITQYFFDIDNHLRFVEKCRKIGITVPIVTGILPIANFTQCVRFSKMCGAKLPDWLFDLYDGLEDESEQMKMVSTKLCADMCLRLIDEGLPEFHFYTLNRPDIPMAVCHILGIRPAKASAEEQAGVGSGQAEDKKTA